MFTGFSVCGFKSRLRTKYPRGPVSRAFAAFKSTRIRKRALPQVHNPPQNFIVQRTSGCYLREIRLKYAASFCRGVC